MREFSPVTIRDILYVFFKYKYKLLIIFLVAVFSAFGYLLYADALYKAETKILVQIGKEKISAIDTYTKEANVLFAERGQNTRNEIEILKDPSLTLAVMPRLKEWLDAAYRPPTTLYQKFKKWLRTTVNSVKEFLYTPLYYVGLATRLTPEQKFAEALNGALSVEYIDQTDIIRLDFDWPNPQFAAFAANAYADEYVRRRIKVHAIPNTQKFYIDQIALYKELLQAGETKLDDLLKANDITDLSTQKSLLLNEISQLESEYNKATIALKDTRLKSKIVETAYKKTKDWIETPDLGSAAPDLSSLDKHYFDTLAQRIELLNSYSEKSRNIASLDFQLEKLRNQKATSLLNFLETRMRAQEGKAQLLEDELKAKRKQLDNLRDHATRVAQLKRDNTVLEDTYLKYEAKAEDMRISHDLNAREITSVKIISAAIPPVKPYYPPKWIILGVAAFLGLFLGFGYATISEFFDHSLRDHSDIEKLLGVPLLLSVPDMNRKLPGIPSRSLNG